MFGFPGLQLVEPFADRLKAPAIATDFIADLLFEIRCGFLLVLNASQQPVRILAKAVQPTTRRYQCVDEFVQTKIPK